MMPLSREEGDVLAEKGLPAGTFLEVDYRRDYLYPSSVSHLLGYTERLQKKNYRTNTTSCVCMGG
jgi:cell division protein FtsI/penicillin-binding protein 2